MNFIVDGMDRCGKSTLIEKLPDLLNKHEPIFATHFPKIKMSYNNCIEYNKNLYTTVFKTLINFNKIGGQFIMDRSHISEFVYGQLYRKYNTNYVFEYEYEELLDNTTLILLVDNPEGIMQRDDGKSNSIKYIDLMSEYKLYKTAFLLTRFNNKILLNINNMTELDVFDVVKKEIKNGNKKR